MKYQVKINDINTVYSKEDFTLTEFESNTIFLYVEDEESES